MGLFKHKKTADQDEIEITKFDIEIIFLDKVPQLDLEDMTVSTFDLSVTELRIPPIQTREIGKDGKEKLIQHPEIIFNLKVPSKSSESKLENISLSKALLPHQHLNVAKSISIDSENVIGEIGGVKYHKKLVFDLVCLTRENMLKTNLDYEEYRRELDLVNKKHNDEIEELKTSYKRWKETMEEPYKDREKQLKDALERAQTEVMELLFKLPQQRNETLKEAIKKLNPMNIGS